MQEANELGLASSVLILHWGEICEDYEVVICIYSLALIHRVQTK